MKKDKDTIQSEYFEFEKLDQVKRLYRYTNSWHIKTGEGVSSTVSPNANATEMLEDMYESGHLMMAKDIGPGLSFLVSKDNEFKDEEKVCVSIDLAEFVKQGGYLYPDRSTYADGVYFCMLPEGEFQVVIED